MERTETAPAPDLPLRVRAKNINVNSENAIHNDKGAQALGFSGGLVSGVTVYGYMVRAVLREMGEAWLGNHALHTAFFKPVYDGDDLTIELASHNGAGISIVASKSDGGAVASLKTGGAMPAVEPMESSWLEAGRSEEERPVFDWDAVVVGRPFRKLVWRPERKLHLEWCESVQDRSPYYTGDDPPLHPSWILQFANNAVTHQFRMNPWIHVSSRITTYRRLKLGDRVEIITVPLEKWEKNGNRFALLRVSMFTDGAQAVDIRHKTILQLAPRV